jgi:hypothetical protein
VLNDASAGGRWSSEVRRRARCSTTPVQGDGGPARSGVGRGAQRRQAQEGGSPTTQGRRAVARWFQVQGRRLNDARAGGRWPGGVRCRGGGSATSVAHAWLPCDRGVVPATISEHRRLVCDPTVAGDHRPRTTTAPMCAPADVPRSPAIGRGVSESRPADETPAFVPGCAPPLSCRVEVAVSCDRGDSAVVERCVEVVKVAVGRSHGDSAVAQRCLDAGSGSGGGRPEGSGLSSGAVSALPKAA